jgi:hypothetical protein
VANDQAEAVHDEGQPAPPLQPNPPSPSADSPSAAQLPLPASDAAEAPADSDAEPFGFDPDAVVAFGDRDAEADRAAWEQIPALAAALRHAAETKASGGPPYLGWFADGAVPAETGRYRFDLDREQLFGALTHLAAVAGRPKQATPTVRIALRPDSCKTSVSGPRSEFAAIDLCLKGAATGFGPGAAPVAFTMPVRKLAGIVRTGEPGVPVRFEFNAARRRLLVLGRRDLRRVPTGVPSQSAQPLLGAPKPVGMFDPLPLVQGLRLLEHVASKRKHWREPGSWSRVYVRDGMVFSFRDTVLGVVQAAGLAGLEAMVHVADLAPVTAIVGRLDGSRTGLFTTEYHSLLTDEGTWVGLWTKADVPFQQSAIMNYLLHHKPSDEIVVCRSDMLPALDRLLAATKGEPGAEWVRLRVKGLGASARLVLQAADRPKRHRGFDELECRRTSKLDAGARAKIVDMQVKLEALRDLVEYFCSAFEFTNVVLDVLPPTAVFPRPVLRLRHEVEKGGYTKGRDTIQAFLIGKS